MPNATLSRQDREHESWTLVARGLQKWDDTLRSYLGAVTERMLSAAGVGAGHHVLDIATGTGEPAIPAAEQVGLTGSVLGVDFVEAVLAIARRKAVAKNLRNVDFRRVDAEELEVSAGAFDAVLIRWGIMFMPNPSLCLARAQRALRSGGRIAVACWAEPERNPWASLPLEILRRHELPLPRAPGVFAFSDPVHLRDALEAAGFVDVRVDEIPVVYGQLDHPRDYFEMVRALAGPIARMYATLSPELRKKVTDEVCVAAEQYRRLGGIEIKGVSWVASGRR